MAMDTEDSDLYPTSGVRLRFVCGEVTEGGVSATYTASLFTASECFEYAAVLSSDGECTLEATGPAAAPALERKLRTLATIIARQDGWPRRVLRWRATPVAK